MDNTWIKLYRKLLEHEVMKDPAAVHVFMWVLLSVDTKGNMTTGRIKAANELGLDPNTFRYILHEKVCKKYKLIEVSLDESKRFTRISVTNWMKYQAHFAEKSLDEQSYPQEVNTKDDDFSLNYLTQENSLKNEDDLTYQSDSLTPNLTQPLTQSLHTKNSLEKDESVTQVLNENLTQQFNTILRNNNKENKNNIYISNVESEKPKEKKASKKSGIDTSRDEEIFDILHHFNKERGKHYKSIEDVRSNALKRLAIYTVEEVKLAIC